MIVFCTDFGSPYSAQMRLALSRVAPDAHSVILFDDLPAFRPQAAAYLLPAYLGETAPDTVFCCVVDPGVGSDRPAVILRAHDRWFIGPDNGLFAVLSRRDPTAKTWRITWKPPALSASFHGRDIFTPLAAALDRDEAPENFGEIQEGLTIDGGNWPEELPEIVYLDCYGNAFTGLRSAQFSQATTLRLGTRKLARRRTFADVQPAEAFCYENSNGLLEIAVNQGSAARELGLRVGQQVEICLDEGQD